MSTKFLTLNTNEDLESANSLIKLFEEKLGQTYPLGNDSFKINHGSNYFLFFKRIGNLYYHIIVVNDNPSGSARRSDSDAEHEIAGVAATVLRNYGNKKFWYICDMKIDPRFRGRGYTILMCLNLIPKFITMTASAYLISMDPQSQHIIHLTTKISNALPFLRIKHDITLKIYQLKKDQMLISQKLLEELHGKVSYLSLGGKKDLILQSNGQPMKILHAQYGPFAEHTDIVTPNDESTTYMFCAPKNSVLDIKLLEHKIDTNVTATVIYHRMPEDFDFNWILTSEI